ncbi:hypothetical protein [Nocardioides speluncae]|uniref:hypothetical protein n=1 Tax=Nocardioides speluncae TaxID=2670337 RepID=UPI000D68F55D|nr:hypothetical protein [Nocardioides speluncae]
MAAMHRTVHVRTEQVDHEHGHWCNDCMLSTGLRWWDVLIIGGRWIFRTIWWCHECGGRNITPAADGDAYHC